MNFSIFDELGNVSRKLNIGKLEVDNFVPDIIENPVVKCLFQLILDICLLFIKEVGTMGSAILVHLI